MLRKIGVALIAVPLAVAMIIFAIANRQWVTVSLDVFSSGESIYAATMPLFIVIFASLILGVLIGGFTTWLGQAGWRRSARQLDGEARTLRQELEIIRRRFAVEQSAANQGREPMRHSAISPPSS